LLVSRPPRALYLDLGNCFLDLEQIVVGEFDVQRSHILLDPVQLARTRDGHDPRLLSKEPGKRDLRRCRLLGIGDSFQEFDKCLVGLHRLGCEAGEPRTHVGFVEGLVRIDLSGQKALTEWTPRHEADAQLLAKELLVAEWAINLSGVKEGDTPVDRGAEK
jgi:hypothetical protein